MIAEPYRQSLCHIRRQVRLSKRSRLETALIEGADHMYDGHEVRVAQIIGSWADTLLSSKRLKAELQTFHRQVTVLNDNNGSSRPPGVELGLAQDGSVWQPGSWPSH
jgi:hypothetical protein